MQFHHFSETMKSSHFIPLRMLGHSVSIPVRSVKLMSSISVAPCWGFTVLAFKARLGGALSNLV